MLFPSFPMAFGAFRIREVRMPADLWCMWPSGGSLARVMAFVAFRHQGGRLPVYVAFRQTPSGPSVARGPGSYGVRFRGSDTVRHRAVRKVRKRTDPDTVLQHAAASVTVRFRGSLPVFTHGHRPAAWCLLSDFPSTKWPRYRTPAVWFSIRTREVRFHDSDLSGLIS